MPINGRGSSYACIYDNICLFQVTKFAVWKDVFPLAPLGFIPDPVKYRITVGVTEVILATLIIAGNQRVRQLSACGLGLIMLGAVQTLVCCNEVADMGPAVVFGIMSGYVYVQYGKNNKIKTD